MKTAMGTVPRVWSGARAALAKRTPRVMAVKLGYNPNSSSLGVDVTFFLVGATALALLPPIAMAWIAMTKRDVGSGSEKTGDANETVDPKNAP